ncbi:MAG: OsmC family protein [Rhodocyclaceae bacterium]|jgi:organic hydroperoxide reductase OsmC/OhrA|nr:OsmC family protein [Rhodocyclaceae bacterium]
MSTYSATIRWQRSGAAFTDQRYSRAHTWHFDGGAVVPGSSSPQTVPLPFSDAAAVDPEEAFVAALSSCHLLWFLHLAAKAGFVIERYEDRADGVLAKNAEGRLAMTLVTLRPRAEFAGEKRPSRSDIEALHHKAHEECFIANSVKSEVRCEPVF